MKFWDASALVPLFIEEPGTSRMQGLWRADEKVVAWWGALVECASALARRFRRGQLADAQYQGALEALVLAAGGWRSVIPSDRLRMDAMIMLRRHPLSAADAFQLAAALTWADHRPSALEFVSLDQRLREAALVEGFTVLPHAM